MEMWKVVPELVRRYDFALADPKREWRVQGLWFVKQTDMDMLFTTRVVEAAQ